jgi:hypothetical protein
MLPGKKCESCHDVVTGKRANHNQTRFCEACAKLKKRENSLNPWTPRQKQAFMREYMRGYRRDHPGLSTPYVRKHREVRKADSDGTCLRSFAVLPLLLALTSSEHLQLSIDALPEIIGFAELLLVKVTGLLIVAVLCGRHLKKFWDDKPK